MDINAGIVDQRVSGLVAEFALEIAELAGPDATKQKSLAFLLLCVTSALDVGFEDAFELVTDGSNDLGVDALHLSDVDDNEFTVTIFQAKYAHKNLDGTSNFPENAIRATIQLVQLIFAPNAQFSMNPRLAPRIEEVRSLVRDGYIPNVRLLCCNNGQKWSQQAQNWIDQSGLAKPQVEWLHFNHDDIVAFMQSARPVNDSLHLTGQAFIENLDFLRVLVGKIAVTELAELFERHGDRLLERNIRRYLGRHSNRVNNAIHQTLVNPEQRKNFYLFNNGITLTCTKLRHNALQGGDYQLLLENIQVINGGQTCKTIQQTIAEASATEAFGDAFVLLRLYELESDADQLVRQITYATNSQNPVDLRDLHSNDALQRQLETGITQLGYHYRRFRDTAPVNPDTFSSVTLAEAVMAIWRQCPHQSKFRRRDLFGALYDKVFSDLNPAQAILAVLIFRIAENARKRPTLFGENPPAFLPYAGHYLAMLLGQQLLLATRTQLTDIDHRNLSELTSTLLAQQDAFLQEATDTLRCALTALYGDRQLSLQQLSATFRRGDLLASLAH